MEEIHWRLLEYLDTGGEMKPALPDTSVDIRFSEGKLTGSAGCNRYFGAYSIEQGQIQLSAPLASTQMACSPPIDQQEQEYLSLLSRAAAWQEREDRLVLFDGQGRPLLRYAAVAPPSLESTEWKATGINNGRGGVVSTASTNLSTATFADGTVSGSGGCNRFNAAYAAEGDQITIGQAAATRKFCAEPAGIMDQEQHFFAALARARTYSLSPGRLELRDETGSLQVGFRSTEP